MQRLETKIVGLISRTLKLLGTSQNLVDLAVYLPGVDGGDIWDLRNENLYFTEEIFSNSTANVHACIPEVLGKIVGITTLNIGYTKDIELAEKVARATGARQIFIQTSPEGHSLGMNEEERAKWLDWGWQLEGKTAYKNLVIDVVEGQGSPEDENVLEYREY